MEEQQTKAHTLVYTVVGGWGDGEGFLFPGSASLPTKKRNVRDGPSTFHGPACGRAGVLSCWFRFFAFMSSTFIYCVQRRLMLRGSPTCARNLLDLFRTSPRPLPHLCSTSSRPLRDLFLSRYIHSPSYSSFQALPQPPTDLFPASHLFSTSSQPLPLPNLLHLFRPRPSLPQPPYAAPWRSSRPPISTPPRPLVSFNGRHSGWTRGWRKRGRMVGGEKMDWQEVENGIWGSGWEEIGTSRISGRGQDEVGKRPGGDREEVGKMSRRGREEVGKRSGRGREYVGKRPGRGREEVEMTLGRTV